MSSGPTRDPDALVAAARAATRDPPHRSVGVRIRQGVEATIERTRTRTRTRRSWRWLAVPVVAALALVAGWSVFMPRQASEAPRFDVVHGRAGAGKELYGPGDQILASRVVTATAGEAVLTVDGIRVRLATGGKLSSPQKSTLRLHAGSATFDVQTRVDAPPVTVHARHVRVEVVGTWFTVNLEPEVSVRVLEGVVRVDDGQNVVDVGALETWPAVAVEPASLPSLPPPTNEKRAVAVPAASIGRVTALIEEGKLAEAAALAEKLSRAEGPAAEVALYMLARLRGGRLAEYDAALATLDEMARRFPDGALVRERKVLRVDVLRASGDAEAASAAIDRLGREDPEAARMLVDPDAEIK